MPTIVCLLLSFALGSVGLAYASDTPQPLTTRSVRYEPAQYSDLPSWGEDDPRPAINAFRLSCDVVGRRASYRRACEAMRAAEPADAAEARAFFEANFRVYRVFDRTRNGGMGESGLMTGYFEPLLVGSLVRTARFRYPLYAIPSDLHYIDLRDFNPGENGQGTTRYAVRKGNELTLLPAIEEPSGLAGEDFFEIALVPQLLDTRSPRMRVRVEGHRVVPYFTRAEIDATTLEGRVLAWVDNPVAVYVLHVQGSGRVRLPNGRIIRIGYAEQNGHPFMPRKISPEDPIAKEQLQTVVVAAQAAGLMPRGPRAARMLPPDSVELRYAQMIAVKDDPSYIFFRELPNNSGGPLGAMGVPLTPERSIAVDPRSVPLGAPLYVSATRAPSGEKINRLMIAQDVGGAIRGPIRADFFWGFGPQAGLQAMRTSDALTKWVLLPNGFQPSRPAAARQARGPARLVERDCVLADDAFCNDG